MILDKFSKWQCKVSEKHPLLCQIGTKVAAVVIVAFVGWACVKAKPIFKILYPSNSEANIIFTNDGLLPSYDVYNIASGPTVVLQPPKILEGKDYLNIENISPNNFLVNIKDLPRNQKIILGVATADTVKPIGNITVNRENWLTGNFGQSTPSTDLNLLVGDKK